VFPWVVPSVFWAEAEPQNHGGAPLLPLFGRQQQTAAVTVSQNLGVRFPVSVGLIKMIKDLDYCRNIQIQIL
jgi:hypothetical protein